MSTPSKSDVVDDPELLELQSSFSEQQAKITALREIIRQTEVVNDMKNATAQEKVKNIAQRLTHFKTKVTTSRLNRANSANTSLLAPITEPNVKYPGDRADAATTSFQRGRSESSPMEKCSLLRQQIEKNRLKMAERESCKREIEEKVIEIKHKLETTQQTLEKSTEHDRRRSYIDGLDTLALDDVGPHVFDPSIRQGLAINQSISIVDDSPWLNSTAYGSREESDSSFYKDSKQNPTSSSIPTAVATQTKNDDLLEGELKALNECLQEKNSIIDDQLLAVCQLVNNVTGFECAWDEDTHRDISLVKELHRLQVNLLEKAHKLTIEEAETRLLETYGYDPLERIREKSNQTQHEKECQNPPGEWSQDVANEEGVDLRNALEKIASLEHSIAAQDQEMEKMNQQMADLRQSLEEKTIELNVMTANVSVLQEKLKSSGPKPLFPRSADEELETEATKLRQQLDESNKTMIKCKLRIKQLQKQVDTFKKVSNVHEEVARLTEELNALSAAGGDGTRQSSRGEAVGEEGTLAPEVQKRIETLELTCQNQATAMQLLEEQKNDLSEDLCRTRNELQLLNERAVVVVGGPEVHGDNGAIATQMLSIELEEQLEKCLADKTELTKVLHTWEAEKAELQQKLKQAMEENGELLGRIEKLSIEKVSSAESIEILENLTAHEKQEMEKSEKRALGQADDTDGGGPAVERDDSKENLNESLLKLMEESKELMDKVEMFTDERREVLEKLDAISIENQAYISELERLKQINAQLCSYSMELESTKSSLEEKLQAIHVEKESILHELDTARTVGGKVVAVEEGTPPVSFQSSSAPDPAATSTDEAYEQALIALENELANYHKNKDKQKKLQVSKKLASNAKNLITASRQLVNDYNACLLERSKLCEQIAMLSQQKQTADAAGFEKEESAVERAERYQLDALKRELEVASEKSSDDEPELLKVELNSKNEEIVALKRMMEAQAKAKSTEMLHLQQQLHEAREQSHLLQLRADKAEQIEQLTTELRRANEAVQQKGETIATLEHRIDELSRSAEALEQRIEELQAANTRADEHPAKAELEQKNQELLDKLKKFAANLKRKNAQCTELEQENKQLAEANRRLMEEQQQLSSPPENDDTALREENEQLAQKLHHLNNELHRLLEQKYQLEAECEAGRDERAALGSQLAAAQEERTALDNRVRELEQELEQLRVELDAGRKEVASKNAKIEKCKAIIKEKIKEAHRLQEHERRTAYLEDELRMTQSKLEDFHNQTLLLGRLKGEKEELNAAVKAEHEQRRRLQHLLDESERKLAGAHDKERSLSDLLAQVEAWVRRFGDRWHSGGEPVPPIDNISHLAEWCAVLVEAERAIERTLAQKTQELAGVDARLHDSEQSARKLHAEMEHTRGQLSTMQQATGEQQQTIAKLAQELEQAQGELQRTMCSSTQMAQLQSDMDGLHSRLQEAETVRSSLQNALATAEQETAQLRETLALCEQALQQEKATADELRAANETLADELQLIRKQTTELDRSHQELRGEYERCEREHEARLEQLREEALAREFKLSDELRRRDSEMDAMREDYDEQLGSNSQAKEQLNVELRRKDQELEVLRRDYEKKLLEEVQTKEQLQDALDRLTREVESLRHDYEEKLLEEVQTKEQLQDALDRLTREVEGYQQKLLEEAQTKEQLQDALATMTHEAESGRRQYVEQQAELTLAKNQLSDALAQKDQELARLRKSCDVQHTQKTQTEQQIDSVIRQKDEELEALCQGYENQLANGRQVKEQLEQTLAQKDRELEEQLAATAQLREQLTDALRRKDEELETLRQRQPDELLQHAKLEAVRQEYEAQLADVKHSKEQLNEALRRKNEELETLRERLEEQMANPGALSKDQLDELQDAELEAVRQDYEAQLADVKHSKEQLNEALQRKDKELESLRKTYKECCEQQDVLGRNHFQELNALQQKLLESVGERVALQQTVDGMSAESERLRARIASLERQTSENLTNTSILSSLNEALNEELDQLQERMQAGGGDGEGSCALEQMLRQKNETIEQLRAQQQLMQQEITDLKVKAGKLLRKLKETRARCDVLEEAATATTSPSDGWDVDVPASTTSLPEDESRSSAAEAERAKLLAEKEALLAKLDTLETACEKLTELKEHQDRQIEALRTASQEPEVLRDRLQHMTAALQTRESELMHLNAQLEQLSGVAEQAEQLRGQLSELEQRAAISSAPTTSTSPTSELVETRLAELEHRNRLLEDEKSEMGRELEALNQQILLDLQFEDRLHKATLELDAKNVELQMLRATLEQMQLAAPTEQVSAPVPVPTTTAYEQQIATLEARVLELEQQKAFYEQQLLDAAPIEALDYERAVEQPAEVVPADAKVREVLERQELEIVTLKEQLAVRSAEYARLAAHVDPTRLLALINSGGVSPPSSGQQQQQSADSRDSRAELELALYMIYQRDMRCDELELELRNLLEERDALQLRLSNALRMHEEFRLKCATVPTGGDATEYGTSGECSIESSPERPATASTDDPRPTSSMSTAADSPDLSSKLSELHSISYSKEKRWQEEREDRNRQLTLIQRDLANMPLEAAAKITGTDVVADADTSSQQSASSVLLNWILGKK
ncbi:protein lava lamp [Anopheles ziemanni]|uniref:protein lava lamp n=1 Tax=Anopheles ziemanni TaxID=345580 RepID=UPI00265E9C27|nr:protein lava lamp [Anopheles ziemanni]